MILDDLKKTISEASEVMERIGKSVDGKALEHILLNQALMAHTPEATAMLLGLARMLSPNTGKAPEVHSAENVISFKTD